MMLSIFINLFSFLGIVVLGVGAITIFYWLKPVDTPSKYTPVDRSNVINRIRLWWWCLKRPYLFVEVFPWLAHDELENLTRRNNV